MSHQEKPRDSGIGAGKDSGSEDDDNSPTPTRGTTPPPPTTTTATMATPSTTPVVQGSQLTAISKYDGTTDVEDWIAEMERAQVQFSWPDAQTAAAAKGKLVGGAAKWLRSTEICSNLYTVWNDQAKPKKERLAEALIARFGVQLAAARATDAVKDLKQRHDESVGSFHDRVVTQVDKKNFTYSAAEKQEASYLKGFKADIYTFFGAGLREEIRKKVLSIPKPPTNHEELLEAAKIVESQEDTAGTKAKGTVLEVQMARPSGEDPEEISLNDPPSGWSMEEMTLCMVEAMKKFRQQPGNKKFTCFNCKGEGHYSSDCPSPKKKTGYKDGPSKAPQWGKPGQKKKKGRKFEELQHEEGFNPESGNDSGEE